MSVPAKVSVILIFFNCEDYIAEAIESVLAQSFRDFELILVDDGSTDGSTAIAQDFARQHDGRVRCVEFPGRLNCGRSAARNLGLKHARGEFVAFIDADDRWRATKLGEQIEILSTMPEVDAVSGAVNYWRSWEARADERIPTGHVENAIVRPPDALVRWYPLGTAHAPSMSDLLMRAATVRDVGGFEDEFTGAYDDQAFLAKFYRQSPIYVSSEVWSDYRLHDRSCMAMLRTEGGYHLARSRFLHWLERYLHESGEAPAPVVAVALRRALLPYRYPPLGPPIRLARRIFRKLAPA